MALPRKSDLKCQARQSSIAIAGSIGVGGSAGIPTLHPWNLYKTKDKPGGIPWGTLEVARAELFGNIVTCLGDRHDPTQEYPEKTLWSLASMCALLQWKVDTEAVCDALERVLLFLRHGSQEVAQEISTATNLTPSDQQKLFAHLRKLPETSSSVPGQEVPPRPPYERARQQ